MGEDLIWFMEHIIGEAAVVSGHSSGGLLAAWLAANSPENAAGIVLEDPPLFSGEGERALQTFAWIDSFTPAHDFLNQNVIQDYPLYYLQHCRWIQFFGDAGEKIIDAAGRYRESHEGPLKFPFLPPSITRPFFFLDDYDPRFGNAFYDFSWFQGFDQAEILSRIQCPAVLIHNRWSIDENGILLGAMNDSDAQRSAALMKDCVLIDLDSGHNSHARRPKDFTAILVEFSGRIDD